jgi:hypothetical protein
MFCDCCKKPIVPPIQWLKVQYTVPGYVVEYYYCGEICKQDHKLQLMREAGI